jgi:aryl-phospho-beta-D-glucosidase BglC (GH1 family)
LLIKRRHFLRNTGLAFGTVAAESAGAAQLAQPRNPLPHWKGFNFLDFFNPDPDKARPATPEILFRWMRDWGFDFVRVPMAYPAYLDIDYRQPITPDDVYRIDEARVDRVQSLVEAAHRLGLHVSLNLHRAPGYCINAGFHEPYNLWRDQAALDAFCHHWTMWATRFAGVSNKLISFDLVNEPSMREDMNDQFGKREAVPPATYHRVASAAVTAIRRVKPDALIIADGNNGGHVAVPELADLGIAQSCRGYVPFNISHYKAPWVYKDGQDIPAPRWPDGPGASREALEQLYQPWFDLLDMGVGVHCGECGSYKETPHAVFLAWFEDVLGVLAEREIGFGLWEMRGTFGILDSGRADVEYEDWYGYKLDRRLLDLLQRA